MKVSIIIPNYNGAALLERNLPKVCDAVSMYKKIEQSEVEIIVIDDASADDSKKILELFKQKVDGNIPFSYYIKDHNSGFAPTINLGVSKSQGEVLVLLNTDVSPQEDFLSPLLKHFSKDKVFAVGAMDKSIEQGKEVLRGRGIGSWTKGFLIHSAGSLDATNTLWVSCGSGAFRRSYWEKLGGLDELFAPFYWEDIDISYRAIKSGYEVLFEKESVVVHEHEEGAIKKKYSEDDVKRIAYRNQFIFTWKNADDTMLWFHLVWLPYHILKALKRSDKNFLNGLWDAKKLLPAILQKRKDAQRQFFSSDYAIIARYKK